MNRRVALVTDTTTHLGPDLARELAKRDHDLVIGEPHDGLVTELEEMGGTVEEVVGVGDLSDPRSIQTLVQRALDRFGRVDSACIRTGTIVTGSSFGTYPSFRAASGADDPSIRALYEAQVPLGRLGQPAEVAHFCGALLDGKSSFQTGQFFSTSGGWNAT